MYASVTFLIRVGMTWIVWARGKPCPRLHCSTQVHRVVQKLGLARGEAGSHELETYLLLVYSVTPGTQAVGSRVSEHHPMMECSPDREQRRDSHSVPGMLVAGDAVFLTVTHRILNRAGICLSLCITWESGLKQFRNLPCGRRSPWSKSKI